MSSYDKNGRVSSNKTSGGDKMASLSKINEILGSRIKNFSQSQQDDLIARLAIIGLRSLQLESKESLHLQSIVSLSNKAASELEESNNGTLRSELSSIKEQLSQLTNRFQTMHQEKTTYQTEPQLPNRSEAYEIKQSNKQQQNSQVGSSTSTQKENKTVPNGYWSGVRQNNDLLSESQAAPVKQVNKIIEQCDTTSSVRSPNHKQRLFELDDSSMKGANLNKKPSSAWRTGERSISANKAQVIVGEGNYSESGEGNSLNQSQNNYSSNIPSKRSSSKTQEVLAQKVTEVKPSLEYHRNDSSSNLPTRHHLDDKLIKDTLWEYQYDSSAGSIPSSATAQQKVKSRLDSESSEQTIDKIPKKKWEVNRQGGNGGSGSRNNTNNHNNNNNNLQYQMLSAGELTYEEMGAGSGSGVAYTSAGVASGNSAQVPAQEFVSLSQPQQFLASHQPFQSFNPAPTQSQSTLPSLAQQQNQMFLQNPNFASPKFKESGRENSLQTQNSTAELKKPPIHPPQQQTSSNNQQNSNNSTTVPKKNGFPPSHPSTQSSPSTTTTSSTPKYGTTKALQKRQELNLQKKKKEEAAAAAAANKEQQKRKNSSFSSSSSSQPSYLKNVTSKIRDDIRLARETSRANQTSGGHSANQEVIIYFKDPQTQTAGALQQTQTGVGTRQHQQQYLMNQNQKQYNSGSDNSQNDPFYQLERNGSEYRTQFQYDLPPMPDVDESSYSGFQDEFIPQAHGQHNSQQHQQFFGNRNANYSQNMWNTSTNNENNMESLEQQQADEYRQQVSYPFGNRQTDAYLQEEKEGIYHEDDEEVQYGRQGEVSRMMYGYGNAEDDEQQDGNINEANTLQQRSGTAMRYRFSGQGTLATTAVGEQSSFYSHHNISGTSHNNNMNNRSTATAFSNTPNNQSLMKIANKFLSSPMMNQISTLPHSHTTSNQRHSSNTGFPSGQQAVNLRNIENDDNDDDDDLVDQDGHVEEDNDVRVEEHPENYEQERYDDQDQDDSSFKVSGYSHSKLPTRHSQENQNYFGGGGIAGMSHTRNFMVARGSRSSSNGNAGLVGSESEQSSMLNGNITNNNIPDSHEQNVFQHEDDQEEGEDDGGEKQNTSLSSSFAPFEPDHDMKVLLQKDGFFKKIFDGDERNISATSGIGENIPNSYGNSFTNVNYQRDESIILPVNEVGMMPSSNGNRFTHQRIEYQQHPSGNMNYAPEDDSINTSTNVQVENRLSRFFVGNNK